MKIWELITLVKPIVDAGLSAANINAVLQQSYQPTQQGVEPVTQVYMQVISSHRYGFPLRDEVWNSGTNQFDYFQTEQMETVFQMGVLQLVNPKKTEQDTAIDILNTVAATLQSSATIATLEAAGVGIYRVTDLRNPYFLNDFDRFQATPSFDFTLTHKQVTIVGNPKIDHTEYGVYPI